MDFPGVSKSLIDERLVQEAYRNFYSSIVGDFFAVLIFTALLWNQVSSLFPLILWLVLMFLLNHLLRTIILHFYYRDKNLAISKQARFWKIYFILNNAISGVLWGLGGLLFLYVDDPLYRLLIFLFLTGLIGAPAAKLMTFYLSYICYFSPLFIVMIAISFSFPLTLNLILIAAIILYLSMVLLNTLTTHRFLIKSTYLEIYSSNLLLNLKRSEEYFRNTLEYAPIGMAIITPDGKFKHTNLTMQQMLGYRGNELQHRSLLEITYSEDRSMTEDAMNKLLKNELHISHLEKRFVQKDGNVIWTMVSTSLVRDEHGKPVNFIMQMKDVSERIHNEEKMRKLNAKTMETLHELKLLEHDESLLNKLNRSLQICVSVDEAYPRIDR